MPERPALAHHLAFAGAALLAIAGAGFGFFVFDASQEKKSPAAASVAQQASPDEIAALLAKQDYARLPSVGPADARVTVVEFLDFQCPFCRQSAQTVERLMEEYRGKPVRFVFRQFPLASIHPAAMPAAHASLCAKEQGKFLAMHDALYAEQERLSNASIVQLAARIGLDMPRFNTCYSTKKYQDIILKDLSDGAALGVQSTPTFLVNDTLLPGALPIEALRSAIDAELK